MSKRESADEALFALDEARANAKNAEHYNDHGPVEQRDFAVRMAEAWAQIATSYAQVAQAEDD